MGLFSSIGKAIKGAVKSVGSVVKKVALPALGLAAGLIPGVGAVVNTVKSIATGAKAVAEQVVESGGVVPALVDAGKTQEKIEKVQAGMGVILPLAAAGVGALYLFGGKKRRR